MSDMYYAGGQCMLVLEENLDKYATKAVSYTHLDVYKRQPARWKRFPASPAFHNGI